LPEEAAGWRHEESGMFGRLRRHYRPGGPDWLLLERG